MLVCYPLPPTVSKASYISLQLAPLGGAVCAASYSARRQAGLCPFVVGWAVMRDSQWDQGSLG